MSYWLKEGEQIRVLKKGKEEMKSENRILKDYEKTQRSYYYTRLCCLLNHVIFQNISLF